MNVTVVHRDPHLLVLSKPPRLPTTHPSGGDCLVRRATALDPDAPHLHASSRLDAEVRAPAGRQWGGRIMGGEGGR